jgi:hypothetical protein
MSPWSQLNVRKTFLFCFDTTSCSQILVLIVPGSCKDLWNLKNPSGVYLKTLCLVRSLANQDTSRSRCAESNMELFTIDSAEVGVAVMSIFNTLFGSGFSWIEGKNGTSCLGLYKVNRTATPYVANLPCGSGYYSFCGYKSKKMIRKLKILRLISIFFRNVGLIVALKN